MSSRLGSNAAIAECRRRLEIVGPGHSIGDWRPLILEIGASVKICHLLHAGCPRVWIAGPKCFTLMNDSETHEGTIMKTVRRLWPMGTMILVLALSAGN